MDKALLVQGHEVKTVLSRSQMLCWGILKLGKQLRARGDQGVSLGERLKGFN